MKQLRTLYTWLEIDEKASPEEIKKAYKTKSKEHHPDRGGDQEIFARIVEARDVLLDDEKRRADDKKVQLARASVNLHNLKEETLNRVKARWEEETKAYTPPEAVTESWSEIFEKLVIRYRTGELTDLDDLERLLFSSNQIITNVLKAGKVKVSNRDFNKDPFEVNVETKVKLSDVAHGVLSEISDTISIAEKVVGIFNKKPTKK